MASDIDSANNLLVGASVDGTIRIMGLPSQPALTHAQAVNLAAWLTAIADPMGTEVIKMLNEITGA